MKTNEIKGYGLTGIKVVFNLMDCYEASHTLERINAFRNLVESGAVLTSIDVQEVSNILELTSMFFEKVAIQPSEMPSIFAPKELEPVEEKEC